MNSSVWCSFIKNLFIITKFYFLMCVRHILCFVGTQSSQKRFPRADLSSFSMSEKRLSVPVWCLRWVKNNWVSLTTASCRSDWMLWAFQEKQSIDVLTVFSPSLGPRSLTMSLNSDGHFKRDFQCLNILQLLFFWISLSIALRRVVHALFQILRHMFQWRLLSQEVDLPILN